jgi:hypothetical protein
MCIALEKDDKKQTIVKTQFTKTLVYWVYQARQTSAVANAAILASPHQKKGQNTYRYYLKP